MYYKFFLLLWTAWFVGAIVNIFWLKQKKNSALLIVLVKAKKKHFTLSSISFTWQEQERCSFIMKKMRQAPEDWKSPVEPNYKFYFV